MQTALWWSPSRSPTPCLQERHIVAIAPLIIIWERMPLSLVRHLMAVFPIISNTTRGLRTASPGLLSYFRLNHASLVQTLVRLFPLRALLPISSALRIPEGLSLIGGRRWRSFVAGSGPIPNWPHRWYFRPPPAGYPADSVCRAAARSHRYHTPFGA